MDEINLPASTVIVRSESEFDPLVNLVPPMMILGTEAEKKKKKILEQRDIVFGQLLNQKHSELLTYKLNEIKLITLTEMGLPEFFGTSVFYERT